MTVTLSREAALVLFEFLSRYSQKGTFAIEDQAEQRVLWDLQAQLESALSEQFDSEYRDVLKRARDALRDTPE